MKGTTSVRLAGSAWELARFALLLSAAARLAGARMPQLVPLLMPLAAPGLVMAGGFAASAMLPEVGRGLAPLLRMGKLLEAIAGVAAVVAAFVVGAPPALPLIGLVAAAALIDLVLFLLLPPGDADASEGPEGGERPSL